ncbi:MAG: PAS domain S-box protein [Actinomycetota bacterium]
METGHGWRKGRQETTMAETSSGDPGFTHDIHNIKRLERMLWLIPTGIQVVDSEGRNVYANRRAQEILGLSFDEITRRYSHSPEWHITDMDGNPLAPQDRIFHRVKRSLQALYDQKLMVWRPDRHWIAISVNAQPLFDDDGVFNGLASAITDITDIVLMERELVRRQEQLEETVRQRTLSLEQLNRRLQREIEVGEGREVELESANRRLQALSLFLQSSRERERSRSAYRVHDEIGQNLTVLQMALKNVEKDYLEGEGAVEAMWQVYGIMDQLLELVNTISEELRPPILDDAGLGAAMEWQCSDFQDKTGIPSRVEQALGEVSLDLEKSTAVFRILQEILANLALRPGVQRVEVETKPQGDMLVMTVDGGGEGIEERDLQRADPLSLDFMREYIGKFSGEVGIIPSGGKGRMVVVRVPL